VSRNDAEHAPLRDQFLAIRRRHGLALVRRHVRDLRLIRATATNCAADMRHAPDALLIRDEHKAVPVREAIGSLEVVGITLNEVGFAVPILVSQQRQMSGPLFRDDDIVVGKYEQSARVLQAGDECRGGESLHHPWRLPCIGDDQGAACRDWIAFRRRQILRLELKALAQRLIGIAGGICRRGLRRGAVLLGTGERTHRRKSQCSRCDRANNASHDILPVSPSPEVLG